MGPSSNKILGTPMTEARNSSEDHNEQPSELKIDKSYYEEESFERNSRDRSYNNRCYRFLYILVTSWQFNFIIFLLIVANAMTLAVYTYD